jgi:hypothetical protein
MSSTYGKLSLSFELNQGRIASSAFTKWLPVIQWGEPRDIPVTGLGEESSGLCPLP